MSDSMLEKEYNVYSEKYDIHGVVKDYGVAIKLIFTFEGKEVEMGLSRGIDTDYKKLGKDLIESYIEKLASPNGERKLQLHYWYISPHEIHGTTYVIGHGIVTGHKKLEDSISIHTSAVEAVFIDIVNEEAVLTTRNSIYHCPLAYLRFDKQDEQPELLPDYERLKEKYKDTILYPSIEPGNVLLVLADFCKYYFHSLYYVPTDAKEIKPVKFSGYAHIGTFQDSYLIQAENGIDLRYFPHYQNIEFYSGETNGCPFYIENIGSSVIYAHTWVGTIKLEPGDRKEVNKENAEDEPPSLANGDLYPAGIF